MSFDLVPLELLAVAMTAVMLALPIAFPLAAGVISTPRSIWSGAGLGLGLALMVGVILAIAGQFLDLHGLLRGLSSAVQLPGLALAIAAAVLIVIRPEGSRVTAVVGILACVLIGLAEPSLTLPALFGISQSVLTVGAGAVMEAVVLVVVVAGLVAVGGRVRVLQIGIAAAGAVAALMAAITVIMDLLRGAAEVAVSGIPLTAQLITTTAALVIGTVVGGVLERGSAQRSDLETGRSQA